MLWHSNLSRRALFSEGIRLLLALPAADALFSPALLLGMGEASRVSLGYLALPGAEANPRPGVLEIMLMELARNTSVDVSVRSVTLTPSSPTLFNYPLIFTFGTREFPPLSEADRSRLERYLRAGGMWFIDDCSGLSRSTFDDSIRGELERIFPQQPLERISESHVLYRTFFLLSRIVGRAEVRSYLEGVTFGEGLTQVIYSRNDLPGAFARDAGGGWLYECVPGGESQRVLAYKLGINLLMYALCLNYKHDLTHVRALLDKRRGVFDE